MARTDEPYGHRGHPFERETRRAARVALILERAVRYLEREGFSRPEAVTFIAGIAVAHAEKQGESWARPENARETINRILDGRGAKDWSIDALIQALFDVGSLLGFEREGS